MIRRAGATRSSMTLPLTYRRPSSCEDPALQLLIMLPKGPACISRQTDPPSGLQVVDVASIHATTDVALGAVRWLGQRRLIGVVLHRGCTTLTCIERRDLHRGRLDERTCMSQEHISAAPKNAGRAEE